jgi:hypothetical protein
MAVSRAHALHSRSLFTRSGFKGLLRCVTEDAPSIRRADAGKSIELCAARALGSRRANYSASCLLTNELYMWNGRILYPS